MEPANGEKKLCMFTAKEYRRNHIIKNYTFFQICKVYLVLFIWEITMVIFKHFFPYLNLETSGGKQEVWVYK